MSSTKYISFFVFFLLNSYSIASESSKNEGELMKMNEMEFIDKEDTMKFLEQMDAKKSGYGKKWILHSYGNGSVEYVSLDPFNSKYSSMKNLRTLVRYTEEELLHLVNFTLFSRNREEDEVLDPKNLAASSFDSFKPTKIITHGWMSSIDSSGLTDIRDAYLKHKEVNVIGVDWRGIAGNILYPSVAAGVPDVGEHLGNVINSLVEEKGASYKNFHIIGHSLGAHVAGYAGRITKEKIGRITGLDPALPGFQYVQGSEGRLDPTDAQFVDVIHTCAGILGMSILTGRADFFPNGGSPFQPGCINEFLPESQSCSHSRAVEYFAESIENPRFWSVQCKDWNDFKRGHCSEHHAIMGEFVSDKLGGVFYLKTAPTSPFALGKNGTVF